MSAGKILGEFEKTFAVVQRNITCTPSKFPIALGLLFILGRNILRQIRNALQKCTFPRVPRSYKIKRPPSPLIAKRHGRVNIEQTLYYTQNMVSTLSINYQMTVYKIREDFVSVYYVTFPFYFSI